MPVKRGILFELQTSLASDADAALDALDKKIQEIQRRANITVSATMAAQHQASATAGTGLVGAAPATNVPANDSPSTANSGDAAERARLRRREQMRRDWEERERVRAEKNAEKIEQINRETLERQRNDLRAAERAKQKEQDRAEAARQKDLQGVQRQRQMQLGRDVKTDERYWSDFENFGQRSKTTRERQEAAEAREAARRQTEAARLDQQQRATNRSGWAGLSAIGREAIAPRDTKDRFQRGLKNIADSEAEERKREQQERADAQRQIATFQREADKQQAAEDRRTQAADQARRRALAQRAQQNKKDVDDFLKQQAEQAARLAKGQKADQDQWDLILGGRPGARGPSRADVADPFGLAGYGRAQAQDRRKQQREQERQSRDAEIALARQREAYNRLGESIGSTTNAVTNLGRGMVMLGLIGERDMGRLTDSLLAVQGTVDAIRGGVGTMRDPGGLFRNLREVHQIGGGRGIGRAILGMGPAARTIAPLAGTGAVGAAGTAGAANVAGGTAAMTSIAPIAGITAAGMAIVASLLKVSRVISDMARPDYAGYGHVGGAVDRNATAAVNRGAGLFGMDVSFHEWLAERNTPFGMTKHERQQHVEGQLRRYNEGIQNSRTLNLLSNIPLLGNIPTYYQSSINVAASNRIAEGQSQRVAERREKRQELGRQQAIGFEYDTRAAQEAMQARRRGREAIYGRQATDAQVDPNSRQWDIQAGRAEAVAFRMREHKENVADAEREERRTGEQLRIASQSGRDTPVFDVAVRQHEEAKRRLVDLDKQSLDLAREQRTVEIDGARQRLQLIRDQVVSQTKQTQGLRDRKEDFEVRYSRMDPIQRQALINAKKRLLDGEQLTFAERDLLRDADADSQQRLRRYERRLGRSLLEEEGAKDVDLGSSEKEDYENARDAKNDLRERHAQTTEREQERLGEGVKIGSTVDNKITISIKAGDNFYQNLEAKYISSMQAFMTDQNERVSKWIEEAQASFEQTMNNRTAEQNQQGRNAAGGGGMP